MYPNAFFLLNTGLSMCTNMCTIFLGMSNALNFSTRWQFIKGHEAPLRVSVLPLKLISRTSLNECLCILTMYCQSITYQSWYFLFVSDILFLNFCLWLIFLLLNMVCLFTLCITSFKASKFTSSIISYFKLRTL